MLDTAVGTFFGDLSAKFGCIFAARKMHTTLLSGILHAPNFYFNQTPVGRILSRFSQDIKIVDDRFPELLHDFIHEFGEVNP